MTLPHALDRSPVVGGVSDESKAQGYVLSLCFAIDTRAYGSQWTTAGDYAPDQRFVDVQLSQHQAEVLARDLNRETGSNTALLNIIRELFPLAQMGAGELWHGPSVEAAERVLAAAGSMLSDDKIKG